MPGFYSISNNSGGPMTIGSAQISANGSKTFWLDDTEYERLSGISTIAVTVDTTTNSAPGLDGKTRLRDEDTNDVDAVKGKVVAVAASFTTTDADAGKTFRATAAVTITMHASAKPGFSFRAAQWAAGVITLAGGTNRSAVTASTAQYKVLHVQVIANADNATPEFVASQV